MDITFKHVTLLLINVATWLVNPTPHNIVGHASTHFGRHVSLEVPKPLKI